MRKGLLFLGIALTAVLAFPVAAAAANSPAQIVNCTTSPNGCFSPNPIRITAGSTVTWTNTSSKAHTATSDAGAWDTGAIGTGATSSAVTFNTPGTFAYHCNFHADMHGSIIVTAAATASPAATAAPTARSSSGGTPRALAQSGSGPVPLLGLLIALAGLLVLSTAWLRRQRG